MSQNDEYIKIVESLGDIKASIVKVETQVQGIEEDIKGIKIEDAEQNRLLAEHIAGVQTNQARLDLEIKTRDKLIQQHENKFQERHKELETRLEVVEFLPKTLKGMGKIIMWLGGIAGATVAIAKLVGFF
jgi:uncharacterized protein YlxW (UPF0749 family)